MTTSKEVFLVLVEMAKKHPDLRAGQLLSNLLDATHVGDGNECRIKCIFHDENVELLARLQLNDGDW